MGLGFFCNAMFGSALWRSWGHGQTAFFVSAGVAACAGGALVTLGFLLDDIVERTKREIFTLWVLWSWLCLCFRLSDRFGTENSNWPYYLMFIVPAVLGIRAKQRGRWGAWMPRTIDEMRDGVPVATTKEPKNK